MTHRPQTPTNQPTRQCIACRVRLPKEALRRYVCTPSDTVLYDPKKRLSGRGAYLCGRTQCLQRAVDRSLFHRAFRRPVKVPPLSALGEPLAAPDRGF